MNKEKKEEKPLVFISHITEEKDVAIEFKKLIERTFPGKVDIFVSSDDESIPVGKKWLEYITKALKKCLAMVIICSPESVMQPWINFEVGVGWARDIPIIPLCHSGMKPSNLPMPLQSLKAINATESSDLKTIFSDFIKDLEIPYTITDFSKFIENVKEFEIQYTFWNDINLSFKEIRTVDERIIEGLKSRKNILIELTESVASYMNSKFEVLEQKNILKFEVATGKEASSKITPLGTFYNYKIKILPDFKDVISDKNFIFYRDFN